MKVLLLGANGMLGSQFKTQIKEEKGIELLALAHNNVDITSYKGLKAFFDEFTPDIVINCVAYTYVDDAEFSSEKKDAMSVNADGPKNIAKLCSKTGAVLIHFSTDYVFGGQKTPPDGYKEDDFPDPLNVYGKTKVRGEELIKKEMMQFFIVRTSWLYGPRPEGDKNFVSTMLRLGGEIMEGERPDLKVVGDQYGCPTYTVDLVRSVLDNFVLKFSDKMPEFGMYHITNDDFTTWYDFAVEIFKIRKSNIEVQKVETSKVPRPAIRPKNSILLNTKLPKLRSWKDALDIYMDSW